MNTFLVHIVGMGRSTKTIINIGADKKMSDLADAICSSKLSNIIDELNDDTHLYGFTTSLYSYFGGRKESHKQYVKYEDDLDSNEKSCYKTSISEVFDCVGKKMLFAYDFGTTTEFIVRRTA